MSRVRVTHASAVEGVLVANTPRHLSVRAGVTRGGSALHFAPWKNSASAADLTVRRRLG